MPSETYVCTTVWAKTRRKPSMNNVDPVISPTHPHPLSLSPTPTHTYTHPHTTPNSPRGAHCIGYTVCAVIQWTHTPPHWRTATHSSWVYVLVCRHYVIVSGTVITICSSVLTGQSATSFTNGLFWFRPTTYLYRNQCMSYLLAGMHTCTYVQTYIYI